MPLTFRYLCFTKVGCGSDKSRKSKLSLALPLTFRYLCFTKVGCGSDKSRKSKLFLALPLTFRYLCFRETLRLLASGGRDGQTVMKWFVYKYFFVRKGDRVPFLVFLSMLVAVGLLRWYFYEHPIKSDEPAAPEIVESEYASFLKKAKADEEARAVRFERGGAERRVETFPFDPNRADSATFVRLGLAPWQARNALKYRAKGGVWRSADDFARLYGLSQADFERLRPYIRIRPEDAAGPARRSREEKTTFVRSEKLAEGSVVDLNTADTTLLKRIPGIGSYYSRKICRYREQLGGFVSAQQIAEVEGLPEGIERWFVVGEQPDVKKINVNRADFKTLVHHPYLDYEQVKVIVTHIHKFGPLTGWDDLRLYKEFSEDDFRRLTPYFVF